MALYPVMKHDELQPPNFIIWSSEHILLNQDPSHPYED